MDENHFRSVCRVQLITMATTTTSVGINVNVQSPDLLIQQKLLLVETLFTVCNCQSKSVNKRLQVDWKSLWKSWSNRTPHTARGVQISPARQSYHYWGITYDYSRQTIKGLSDHFCHAETSVFLLFNSKTMDHHLL